jgi:hypothetical protein
MIGTVILSAAHQGDLFSQGSNTWALLNGQVLPRSSWPTLSAYWPEGAYGSTPTSIALPDLSGGYLFRGHHFQTTVDSNYATRAVPSGSNPTAPSGIGTFQAANMVTHTHPSGTQPPLYGPGNSGGDSNAPPTYSTTNSNVPTFFTGGIVVGAASTTAFDVAHMKFYPYIKIS